MSPRYTGDELIEPFRSRNTQRPIADALSCVNEKIQQFSISSSWTRLTFRRRTTVDSADQSSEEAKKQLLNQLPIRNSLHSSRITSSCNDTAEVEDYHEKIVSLVHDDEVFQKLKEKMRKNTRSGFGSQHLIRKYIEEREAKKPRERSPTREDRPMDSSRRNLRELTFLKSEFSPKFPEKDDEGLNGLPDEVLCENCPSLVKHTEKLFTSGGLFRSSFHSRLGTQRRVETPPCA
jgi:hypothetical protein